jgi:hypothetical protein
MDTATMIDQLRTLGRLTRTEVQVGRSRVAQARTDAVRRELRENAENGVRRSRRIAAQLRAFDAVPDVVGPVVSGVVALVGNVVEQGRPIEEALLDDLALEHQLLDRARYLRVLAEHAGREDVRGLADDLVTAHTATVEWISTVLAEEALGGPAALRPTPLQAFAAGVSRAMTLPTRVAVAGFNHAVHTVRRAGSNAEEAAREAGATVTRLSGDAFEVASAGRDAALRRAEQVAEREGARDTAGAVHTTRRNLGALSAAELPVKDYDELTAPNAIAAIRDLSAPDEINAVLAYEERHKNRTGVVSAAQTHYADIAKETAGIGSTSD